MAKKTIKDLELDLRLRDITDAERKVSDSTYAKKYVEKVAVVIGSVALTTIIAAIFKLLLK